MKLAEAVERARKFYEYALRCPHSPCMLDPEKVALRTLIEHAELSAPPVEGMQGVAIGAEARRLMETQEDGR